MPWRCSPVPRCVTPQTRRLGGRSGPRSSCRNPAAVRAPQRRLGAQAGGGILLNAVTVTLALGAAPVAVGVAVPVAVSPPTVVAGPMAFRAQSLPPLAEHPLALPAGAPRAQVPQPGWPSRVAATAVMSLTWSNSHRRTARRPAPQVTAPRQVTGNGAASAGSEEAVAKAVAATAAATATATAEPLRRVAAVPLALERATAAKESSWLRALMCSAPMYAVAFHMSWLFLMDLLWLAQFSPALRCLRRWWRVFYVVVDRLPGKWGPRLPGCLCRHPLPRLLQTAGRWHRPLRIGRSGTSLFPPLSLWTCRRTKP